MAVRITLAFFFIIVLASFFYQGLDWDSTLTTLILIAFLFYFEKYVNSKSYLCIFIKDISYPKYKTPNGIIIGGGVMGTEQVSRRLELPFIPYIGMQISQVLLGIKKNKPKHYLIKRPENNDYDYLYKFNSGSIEKVLWSSASASSNGIFRCSVKGLEITNDEDIGASLLKVMLDGWILNSELRFHVYEFLKKLEAEIAQDSDLYEDIRKYKKILELNERYFSV